MKVSIIIPNWNGRQLMEKNLPHVLTAAKNAKNEIAEIIVVDDASPDNSLEFLKENYAKDIRIVQLKKNRGFSGAVNMGVYAAKFPLICLLNIDVLPSKNFLESVHQLFDDKKVFAVSLHEDGHGPAIGEFRDGFFHHRPGKEINSVQESMWASGGSAVFRRSLWIKLKGLDETLYSPFYWEDVDLSYRAWKRGYKILWDPKAKVNHVHESVINSDSFNKNYLNLIKERNYLIFNWKNITSDSLRKKHKKELFRYILRHPGYIKVYIEAWKRREEIERKREKEIKQSTVSDEAIFARFNQ